MEVISRVLAPSPFELLRHFAVDVQAYLQRLPLLWQAAVAGDTEQQRRLSIEIATIGSQVALVADDLLDDLSRGMPLSARREDLIALIHSELLMVERCQRVAEMLGERCFFLPESVRDPVDRFAMQAIAVAAAATELISQLVRLAELAFGGPQRTRALALVEELQDKKWECDRLGSLAEQQVNGLSDAAQPAARSMVRCLTSQLSQLSEDVGHCAHQFRELLSPRRERSHVAKRRHGFGRVCPQCHRLRGLRPMAGADLQVRP